MKRITWLILSLFLAIFLSPSCAHAVVTSTTNQVTYSYSGGGDNDTFAYTFYITDDEDLEVVKVLADDSETTLTLTTDYTVTGVGAATGGNVELVSALTSGQSVVITRRPSYTQDTRYPYGGPISSRVMEQSLDRIVMMIQSLDEKSNRAVYMPIAGIALGASTVMPVPEPDKALKWNAAGTALVNYLPNQSLVADDTSIAVVDDGVDPGMVLFYLDSTSDYAAGFTRDSANYHDIMFLGDDALTSGYIKLNSDNTIFGPVIHFSGNLHDPADRNYSFNLYRYDTAMKLDRVDFSGSTYDIFSVNDSMFDLMSGSLRISAGGLNFVTLGSASSPKISIAGDSNTGPYWPGADNYGISTGGTLRWDASTTAITSALPNLGVSGSVSAPGWSFSDDPNTGLYSIGADNLGIATGGVQALDISAAGIVSTATLSAATGDEYARVINYTTNKATSGDDYGLYIDKTDTSSPGTSYLIYATKDTSERFSVTDAGEGYLSSSLYVPAVYSTAGVDLTLSPFSNGYGVRLKGKTTGGSAYNAVSIIGGANVYPDFAHNGVWQGTYTANGHLGRITTTSPVTTANNTMGFHVDPSNNLICTVRIGGVSYTYTKEPD